MPNLKIIDLDNIPNEAYAFAQDWVNSRLLHTNNLDVADVTRMVLNATPTLNKAIVDLDGVDEPWVIDTRKAMFGGSVIVGVTDSAGSPIIELDEYNISTYEYDPCMDFATDEIRDQILNLPATLALVKQQEAEIARLREALKPNIFWDVDMPEDSYSDPEEIVDYYYGHDGENIIVEVQQGVILKDRIFAAVKNGETEVFKNIDDAKAFLAAAALGEKE